MITDFGSARVLSDKRDVETLGNHQDGMAEKDPTCTDPLQIEFNVTTTEMTVTGFRYTTRWAAPEVLNNDGCDLWSDIWAFGWICFEVGFPSDLMHHDSTDLISSGYDQRLSISRDIQR